MSKFEIWGEFIIYLIMIVFIFGSGSAIMICAAIDLNSIITMIGALAFLAGAFVLLGIIVKELDYKLKRLEK